MDHGLREPPILEDALPFKVKGIHYLPAVIVLHVLHQAVQEIQ